MYMKKSIRNLLLILSFTLFLNICTVLIGGAKSTVHIINNTDLLIDVTCEETSYYFIEPGDHVSHTLSAKESVLVKLEYCADQSLVGSARRYITLPYKEETESCECSSDDGESQPNCVTNPEEGGEARWYVEPEDMRSS